MNNIVRILSKESQVSELNAKRRRHAGLAEIISGFQLITPIAPIVATTKARVTSRPSFLPLSATTTISIMALIAKSNTFQVTTPPTKTFYHYDGECHTLQTCYCHSPLTTVTPSSLLVDVSYVGVTYSYSPLILAIEPEVMNKLTKRRLINEL